MSEKQIRTKKKNILRTEWTVEEEIELEELIHKYPVSYLAKRLKRSANNIYIQLKALNINLTDLDDKVILSQFCEVTHFKKNTLYYYEKRYGFPIIRNYYEEPAKRNRSKKPRKESKPTVYRSKHNKVCPQQFWKWAKAHKNLIDWKAFPKYALGYEPDWVNDLRKMPLPEERKTEWDTYALQSLKLDLLKEKYTYNDLAVKYETTPAVLSRIITTNLYPLPMRARFVRRSVEELVYISDQANELTEVEIALTVDRSETYVKQRIQELTMLESMHDDIKLGKPLLEIAKEYQYSLQNIMYFYEGFEDNKSYPEILYGFTAHKKELKKNLNKITYLESKKAAKEKNKDYVYPTGSDNNFTVEEIPAMYVISR